MSDDALGLAEAGLRWLVRWLILYSCAIELSRLRNAMRQAMCGAAHQTLYKKNLCEMLIYVDSYGEMRCIEV